MLIILNVIASIAFGVSLGNGAGYLPYYGDAFVGCLIVGLILGSIVYHSIVGLVKAHRVPV